ncbi:MAG TPA: hypothetical protein VF844_09380 [Ktedonobacteraceae bacterium]
MQLPPEQVRRFYDIWFELLHYVHEQRHLAPNFPDTPTAMSISPDDALQLRNALWADDALRESFIATNPAGLPSADLALVASWKYRVDGNFFIVRHLKKYSVFLSEQPAAHAYGVLGLVSPIEDVVMYPLPVYIHAVLLPFEGQITYDSLLEPYSITFGPGIRSGVNDAYRNTQEREGIITTLEPAEVPADLHEVRKGIITRNTKILGAFRKAMARRGLSHTMVEKHASNIDTFAQNYLLAQNPPRGLLEVTPADVQIYLRTSGDETLTTSFKRYVRFLDETARMDDYEQIKSLHAVLK